MIGPQGENLIFVISQPRAGSTLLQRILAGHSSIFATAEPWIMLHPLYALRERGHTAEYNEEWARMALKDFCANLEGGEQAYLDAIRQMGVSLYNNALRPGGRPCFLDKTPRYYWIAPELLRTFPKASFVFLLRNPLAVLSSVLCSWIGEDWPRLDFYRGDLLDAPRLMDVALREFGSKAILLHYEELVQEPASTVRRLCSDLKLTFEPQMIEYGRTPKPKGNMGDDVGIDRFTRPVTHSVTKWAQALATPRHRLLAESYLAKLDPALLQRLGYSREELSGVLRETSLDPAGIPVAWREHAAQLFDLSVTKIDSILAQAAAGPARLDPPLPFLPAAPPIPAAGVGLAASTARQSGFELKAVAGACVAEADQHLAAGDLDRAQEWLERAIDVEPRHPELHLALANVHSQRGQLEPAYAALRTASDLRPDDPLIQVLVGSVCARLGRIEEFEKALERALELSPGHPEALKLLATLNFQQSRFADAGKLLQQVVQKKPGDVEAWLSLGKCQYQQGDRTAARVSFESVLRQHPGHPLASENLAVLNDLAPKREETAAAHPKGSSSSTDPAVIPAGNSISAPRILVRGPRPRLTLVTPSFNQGRFLEECLDSVLSQNYPNLEYIVMDGGSQDNSVEILKKYGRHLAHWQSGPDDGQYHAVQAGFDRGRGEVMAWLNSDDKLHPGALDFVATAFASDPAVEWITGRPTAWSEDGLLRHVAARLPEWTREKYLAGQFEEGYLQQESTFWRRTLWERAGSRLAKEWRLAADFELWARFFRHARLHALDALLAGFRQHSEQKTARVMVEYEREVAVILEQENQPSKESAPSLAAPSHGAPAALSLPTLLRTGAPRIGPENFSYFTYSKHPHFAFFRDHGVTLHGQPPDPTRCDLKVYQDLLVYSFIRDNIPPGSKLLEVGGGDSRILKALHREYECWNLDKLEGAGNGLTQVQPEGYRLVKDYLGNFNRELPEGYFDCVFSISVLEHLTENAEQFRNLCLDLDRVLKPQGHSLHCVDVVQGKELRANLILPYLFHYTQPAHGFVPLTQPHRDPHTFFMAKAPYDKGWKPITRREYEDFGRPLSYNILWQKTGEALRNRIPAGAPLPGLTPVTPARSELATPPEGPTAKLPESDAPLITVLISVYAAERYLRACLQDLVRQTIFSRLEILVIDSGSPENEAAIVKEFQKRYPNIQYHRTERETLYAAWNRGIELARGRYITNANADDGHREDALELLAAALEAHPEADLAYGDYYTTANPNDSFAQPRVLRQVAHPPYHPATVMMYCVTGCHPMWRRDVFTKLGKFDPTFTAPGDYEFLLRFVQAGLRAVHVPQPLSLFYQNPDGLSWKSAAQTKNEGDRIFGQYRPQMPIERIFKVDPADAPAVARAWTALGNVALQHEVPWSSNYVQALPYARLCYERALQADHQCAPARQNLFLLRCLQSSSPQPSDLHLLQGLSPERAAAIRAEVAAGRICPEPVELPPAVEPLEFGGGGGSPSPGPWSPAVLPAPGPSNTAPSASGLGMIRVVAPFSNGSEIAADARALVLPLAARETIYTLELEPYSHAFAQTLPEEVHRQLRATRTGFQLAQGGICIAFGPPGQLTPVQDSAYQIGRTQFAADRLPREAVRCCNALDELWVHSPLALEQFAASGVERDKLFVIPGAVDAEQFDPQRHQPWPLPNPARYNFLAHLEWSTRHGWEALLDAYFDEFTAADDVCLYIRAHLEESRAEHSPSTIEQQIRQRLRDRGISKKHLARYELLPADFPAADLPRLYRAVDCVVCPGRGETWNRTAHEAVMMGLPVIATHWGGHTSLITEATGFPVNFTLGPATNLEPGEWACYGANWAHPDPTHLRQRLREVQQGPEAARARGAAGRQHAIKYFSSAAVTQQMRDRLQAIHDKMTRPACTPVTAHPPVHLPPSLQPRPAVSIAWEGSFLDLGSLSHVNRELSRQLARQPKTTVTCVGKNLLPSELGKHPLIMETARRLKYPGPKNADVTVRLSWPPNWERPAAGAWIFAQPWEFGVLPQDWVQRLSAVDQIWAISSYVRRVYIESGVDPEKVRIVPNGIDPDQFRPEAPPLALETRKQYRFLFVGGTIYRKGPDVLLQAYLKAFTAADDVCLVIKDFGGQSVYSGQTWESQIREAQTRPNAPEILYLNEEIAPEQLPGLYTACQCLVHPYRGEGFGLPVLEAMACGLPVIVTGGGSTDDFATDEFAYRLPAVRRSIGSTVSGLKLQRPGWLLEPDAESLRERLQWVLSHPDLARGKGQAASAHVRKEWTWERSAQIASAWLQEFVAKNKPASSHPSRRAPAIQLPPVARLAHLAPARELFEQGQLVAAWNAGVGALRLRPFHPEAVLLLAEIARAAGQTAKAKDLAERARAMAPKWKPARQFLKASPPKGVTPTSLPELPEGLLFSAKRPRLSVFLITKNEERFIGQCLESVRELADQIVVADTGSTDWTRDIAARYGAEVISIDWTEDFSAARNAALEQVRGDWVLMLDADEELLPDQRDALLAALRDPQAMAFRLPMVDKGREEEGVSYVPRLFRNAPGLFYVGRVHEQIFSSLEVRREEWGLENKLGTVRLFHHGYVKEVVQSRDKVARNLHLLQRALEEFPGEPNLLMNLGLELNRAGHAFAGLHQYAAALEALGALPTDEVVPELRETLLTQYATHLLGIKDFSGVDRALRSPLARAAGLTASQHWLLGLACCECKHYPEAAEQMRQCLAKRELPVLSPVNRNILKGGPHHLLGLCLAAMKQAKEAEASFRAALAADPGSKSIQFDYARFLAENGQEIEALKLTHQLAMQDPSNPMLWRFGGQVSLSKPEFLEFALDWTGEAQRLFPAQSAIVAQRAQALLLSSQVEKALPLWRELASGSNLSAHAACLLCLAAHGQPLPDIPESARAPLSQEFLIWYRRLLGTNAVKVVQTLNERLAELRSRVPAAVQTIEAAMAEANTVP